MVLHPSRPHSELVYFNSPLQVNFAFKAKSSDQDPGTTQHRGQFSPNLNNGYDIVVSMKINTSDANIIMNISIQSLRCYIHNYFHLFLFYKVCIVNVFLKKKNYDFYIRYIKNNNDMTSNVFLKKISSPKNVSAKLKTWTMWTP